MSKHKKKFVKLDFLAGSGSPWHLAACPECGAGALEYCGGENWATVPVCAARSVAAREMGITLKTPREPLVVAMYMASQSDE